jgi:hypothetical protein
MQLIRKIWFRILISLIGGGAVVEIYHLTTGDPNRVMTSNPSLWVAAFIFVIFTVGIYLYDYWQFRQ